MSNQLQDSWLIRALLNIPFGQELTEWHFEKSCEVLRDFNVYDGKDTEKAISDVLLKCFDMQEFDKKAVELKKHENIYKKTKFEELPQKIQKKFNERKYWDLKLYRYFIP